MNFEVKIPPMGESISSGILAKWHVKDGDTVKKDQPLFELETDTITSEGTAESAGRISLKVAAGTEVKIGELVATINSEASAGAAAPTASPTARRRGWATKRSSAKRLRQFWRVRASTSLTRKPSKPSWSACARRWAKTYRRQNRFRP